ncbi:DciA family protein [Halothiobacillus sp. DCM-1]|uniref:DciA family protein n=1 Tax=Halothiobacillus sp. DCM-1 TaxID=3112558 RepID=UPI003245D9EE
MKAQQFSAFSALARHAQRNRWFDCFWHEVVPAALSQRVQVLNVREATLVLGAQDAATATQARFQAPSWLPALNTAARAQGIEGVDRIEVRVTPPRPALRQARLTPPTPLSEATRQHLLDVSAQLDDPQLANALRRLAQQRPRSRKPEKSKGSAD